MDKNVITHNLMTFSGFKGMLIFNMLIEKPCSYKEIQAAIANNPCLSETVSFDTIRIYMNSLREIGCNIQTIRKGKDKLFYIDNHPFELKITDKQVQGIIKVYKAISKSISIDEFITLKSFFDKISVYITNEDLKRKLEKISPINKIDFELINRLREHAANNSEITIEYNSGASKKKNIDILVNKMYISNGKLYIAGINSEYGNYSSFLVSKISKIVSVNVNERKLQIPVLHVIYEITKTDNPEFELMENEKILKEDNGKLVIEITSENKFMITQRVLSLANRCKVISPSDYKDEIIACLKKMKESYLYAK